MADAKKTKHYNVHCMVRKEEGSGDQVAIVDVRSCIEKLGASNPGQDVFFAISVSFVGLESD